MPILNKKQKVFLLSAAGGIFILAMFGFYFLSAYSRAASFKITINNNSEQTSSRQVTLTLKAGPDTK
ncbi:MAG: hypothetical protein AAB529_02235, partial [Patescibacteria group bacterium]